VRSDNTRRMIKREKIGNKVFTNYLAENVASGTILSTETTKIKRFSGRRGDHIESTRRE